MKSRNLVLRVGLALLALAFVVVGNGCGDGGGEDKDSNPGDPKEITGAAGLSVKVEDYITNIYFDDQYLGTLAPGETRAWNVPVGQHTVTATNAEQDNQHPDSITLDFKENETIPLTITWREEGNSLF